MLICALFLLGMACNQETELVTAEQESPTNKVSTEIAIAPGSVVQDELTGQLLYEAGDPYTLANVKEAYMRIVAGKSRHEVTRAQIDDLIEIGEPEATHYSLKFYPRSETEQWRIMRIEGLKYSFYPFEYLPLTDKQVESLEVSRSSVPTLPFECRYSVTYTDLMTTEGPAEPQTIHLPTIYATWPVETPLPTDLEYEIVEELYLPKYNGSESDPSVALLESEIIPITPPWGDDPVWPPVINLPRFKGRIMHYDEKLDTYIPLGGASVTMRYGSNMVGAVTDNDGYFVIYDYITSIATTWLDLSNYNYFVSSVANISAPYGEIIGLADDFPYGIELDQAPTTTSIYLTTNTYPYYETACAAYFYFYGDHNLEPKHQVDGLRMSIYDFIPGDPGGRFTIYGDNKSYIEIYDVTYVMNDNYVHTIETVFHELGHYNQFYEMEGDFDKMSNMQEFIAEAYASYVAYYLTNEYYSIYNMSFAPDYLFESRQDWYKYCGPSKYTPLFVDLFDTYNQSTNTIFNFPYDNLSGFSHEAMKLIAQEAVTWEVLKTILRSYINIFYSADDINVYLEYYDSWIEHMKLCNMWED